MQDQVSVKLLYEQTGSEPKTTVATWSAAPAARRSSAGVCVAVLAAVLMFVLGVLLGGFLHALAFPDGSSPLALRNSSANDSEFQFLNVSDSTDIENLSENNAESSEADLTAEAATISEENGDADEDCADFPWKNFRYVYLGREVNMTNDLSPELGRRKRAVWGAFKSVEEVVRKTKNARLRAHLFDSTILPALTYASESWALRKQDEHAI
ncbi:hypothetical protein Q1695_010119 [Nippostrongylus brasiliensis]|nr:hypothetical protein Q1695_010119 [Nippostrongylus brasiliensis]